MDSIEFKNRIFVLSERLYPMVHRLLRSTTDTEDAIQEVMMKLWENRQQLEKHPNVNAYVFLITKNHCLDRLRKKTPLLNEQVLHFAQSDFTTDSELDWEELNAHITNLLKTVPAQQAEVLVHKDIDGLSINEISLIMDLNEPHVRVLLSRARKYMRVELDKLYNYGKEYKREGNQQGSVASLF